MYYYLSFRFFKLDFFGFHDLSFLVKPHMPRGGAIKLSDFRMIRLRFPDY